MIPFRLLLVLVLSLAARGQVVALDEGPRIATVHAHLVGVFGYPIGQGRIEMVRKGETTPKLSASEDGDFVRVPYGTYVVKAIVTGFNSREQALEVGRPEVWVTLALTVGSVGGVDPEPVLSGRVIPPVTTGRAWAKLVGVYNNVNMETAVSSRGFFLFEPKLPGLYVVLVINGERVLDMQQFELRGNRVVEMRGAPQK